MCEFEFVDSDVFLADFEDNVWYACEESDEVEYGDYFEFADCTDGEVVYEVCDEEDPEAE